MAVKSGILAGLAATVLIVAPIFLFHRKGDFTYFKFAVCLGILTEHMLYPGFINEFIIINYCLFKSVYYQPKTEIRNHHPRSAHLAV